MTKLFRPLFQKMTDRTISCSLLLLILISIFFFFYGKDLTLILIVTLITIPLYIIFLLKPTEQFVGKLRKRYYQNEQQN